MRPSRTPQGVRGLKSTAGSRYMAIHLSHPARGAWIEITQPGKCEKERSVAPRKGCVD